MAHVTRFPAQGDAWANVLLAGAMGVRQDFYVPLARYLASHGLNVVTFDYEGIGRARPRRLADVEADVDDWVRADYAPALEAARAMAPALPLVLFGHSLGGQVLGMAPGSERVRAAVTVTAGSGYYRFNERMRWRLRFFWFVAAPLLTPLYGYFPGKRLRMVGDLPRNVMRQWRGWCLHPGYLLREGEALRAAYARLELPILAWSFADDPMITGPAVEAMHRAFTCARVEHRHVDPRAAGREPIGHVGFFLPHCEPLWLESLQWLRREAAAS